MNYLNMFDFDESGQKTQKVTHIIERRSGLNGRGLSLRWLKSLISRPKANEKQK